jgi:NAD(P)-dependent dehydrogenase (short-subunit alcohol dehydrogenase family)
MKSVLVTGASTGIGRECALDLSRAGWRVFAGVRKTEDGESLRAESRDGTIPVILDVTDEKSIQRASAMVAADLAGTGLDGLVNNAGITVQGPLEFVPLAMFEQQLKVNVTGQLAVTQAFLPLIRKNRGRIVFMGSESGRFTLPLLGPYSTSKFALEAIADALRLELRSAGIKVSLMEPGSAKTKIWDKAVENSERIIKAMPAQARQYYASELELLSKLPARMNQMAFSPKKVSKAVIHALTAKRPGTRYVIGAEAKAMVFFYHLTPTRMTDWITIKVMRLLGRIL